LIGSSYRLYPTPDSAYTVRLQYYLRPSRIVEKQATTDIGQIISVDSATRTLTVSTVASIINKDTGAAITTGQLIDIVRGPLALVQSGTVQAFDASYEAVMANVSWNDAPFSVILNGTADMSEVQLGDYIRAADQSEWPAMPHEYHPALAWAVAAKIARDRGMQNTAAGLEQDVMRALGEMADDVQPRVKSSAQTLVPRAHMLRRGGYF
jgi:hypothetical protein